MAQEKKTQKGLLTTGNVYSIIAVVVIIFVAWLFLPHWIYKSTGLVNDENDIGKLGDMYGLLNTLFTGLSIVALIVTILIQQKEIRDNLRISRYARFENTFFKYIDLRNALYASLENSFANFEKDIIVANLKPDETLEQTRDRYQKHVEQPDVVKNYVNYLAMFSIMVNAINTKKKLDTRIKYYTLLSAQLHINEIRFFLYHFTLSNQKPVRWNELKKYLLAGITIHAIHQDFRKLKFDGLDV
jgi:hypothetical protein